MFAVAVTLNAELFELAFIDKFEYTPNCVSYSVKLSQFQFKLAAKDYRSSESTAFLAEGQTGKTV